MKKILILTLSLLLTFNLTACGTKDKQTENPSANNNMGNNSYNVSDLPIGDENVNITSNVAMFYYFSNNFFGENSYFRNWKDYQYIYACYITSVESN